MTDPVAHARELLCQLLAAGPQKGAWLKVLLAKEFERQTGTTFQQAFWNFPKFSVFLAANADILDVVAPGGPGDITVKLRQAATPEGSVGAVPESVSSQKFLRRPVWNAFTNPDPLRRRFFHRVNGEIAHYVEGSQEAPNAAIAAAVAADSNYVEIIPLSAEQQGAWLKEFLASVSVPESKRSLLATLAATPYSSAVNTAFVATLGDYAESWRQFRAARVQDAVRAWAERRAVPLDGIVGLPMLANRVTAEHTRPGLAVPTRQASVSVHEQRRWLHWVVDTLDAADVSQILLPAGILYKLTTRRG